MKSKLKPKVKAWMKKHWGERCPDYCRTCALCKAWKCYDYLFQHQE
ncbi:MAG TPA: hypothetical protein VI933_01105 [archaeon]|nr:hypothetical protein [archaeon]